MAIYKTPNVYVEEKSILSPSVASVSTAIPAFIGHTETALKNNQSVTNKAVRIGSLREYESIFGGAPVTEFTVHIDTQGAIEEIVSEELTYLMYHSLQMYFANGGGDCYIVSVGDYTKDISKETILEGLDALRQEDEPTLLLVTDARSTITYTGNEVDSSDYGEICQAMLQQCADMQDRFAIIDVLGDKGLDDVTAFREAVGMNNLKYGAAYFPYLNTTLGYFYSDTSVTVEYAEKKYETSSANGLRVIYAGSSDSNPLTPQVAIIDETANANSFIFTPDTTNKTITLTINLDKAGNTASEVLENWEDEADKHSFLLEKMGDGTSTLTILSPTAFGSVLLGSNEIKQNKTALYNQIKVALDNQRVTLPPSSAVAGVYASVDRDRGVWKAPANVSLAAVIGPVIKLTNNQQDNLNVDVTAGKSINAIRSFTGKGTLIWGARTLAGNDNEWRYVSVRRLFNLVEESLQKATSFAVFEPNNAITWLKLRTMTQSYLDDLWRQGALIGNSPDEAFFVKVGPGETMTEQDILEGRLILEIGLAAVRPAEFIILRFSHKLQQA